MDISKFNEKFNRIDENIYTIEEVVTLVEGTYETELIHDNVNIKTLNIYTGSKLTGTKITTYSTSTPSLTPWKTVIKIFSNISPLYISYETTGDQVEAEDINNLQDAVNITQEELNKETNRAVKRENEIEKNLNSEIERAKGAEKNISDNLGNEITRSKNKENELLNNIENETKRASATESKINADLNTEINRAKNAESTENTRATNAESTIAINLNKEIDRAKTKENSIESNFNNYKTSNDSEIQGLKAKDIDLDNKKANLDHVNLELNKRYTKDQTFTREEVLKKIQDLIGTAPDTLDTFKEIADALGNDPNFATTIMNELSSKVDKVTGKSLSTNDYDNAEKTKLADVNAKKHEHSNKNVIDKITQGLLDAWNSAYSHISDTIKHITSDERMLWNTVSNKTDKGHIHDDRYYTESEIETKMNSKANSSHTHTKSQITDMPKKVSEFTNDAGFITQKDIDISQNHTHSNKSVLDGITQTLINTWNSVNNKSDKSYVDGELNKKANSSHMHFIDRKSADDLPSTWPIGMYMSEVYNNGFPCSYGNCLTLKSSNSAITQICMEWKGSDVTIGSMWIRNKRDTGVDKFSDFREFSFNGHTHTKSSITDMPTKLSQFSNDTGFIKKSMTWNELEGV
ncbi:hypothetical protein FC961_12780 [Clostridium botulinum]|nr:hypothetical protein [Clostridium botulinum]NFO92452.1 hypothetical protein [Clostridium botulinum]